MGGTTKLEVLARCPYIWNAKCYIDFIKTFLDLIRDGKPTDEQRRIQNDINKESQVVFGTKNFVEMMGEELWDILKCDKHSIERYWFLNPKEKKMVVQLCIIIRDKDEHLKDYKAEDKSKLRQFFNMEYENCKIIYKFYRAKYVQFCASTFPKLMPFLWLKLNPQKKNLIDHYPNHLVGTPRHLNILLDLNKFEKELKNALIYHTAEGNLLQRFTGNHCSLEFRAFTNLVKILNKNKFVRMVFKTKTQESGQVLSLSVAHSSKIEESLEYVGTARGTENLVLIFTDNINKDKLWENCKYSDSRVIIFCYKEKLNCDSVLEAIDKFCEVNEIPSSELLETPVTGSELPPCKLKRLYTKTGLRIQENFVKFKKIFSKKDGKNVIMKLNVDVLNKLLRQGNIVLCEKFKYPVNEGVYINSLSENSFVEKVNSGSIKSVYFQSYSGMGKGKLMISLGRQLEKSFVIYCPFRQFVDNLKKKNGEECTKLSIIYTILDILGCEDESERQIITEWLGQKCKRVYPITLQLVALDQVTTKNLELALKAMKIIKDDLDIIRLWVTSNQQLPSESRRLGFTYCGLVPFSVEDQCTYLARCLNSDNIENLPDHAFELPGKIVEFFCVFEDLFAPVAFLSHPLHCSLVAELSKDILPEKRNISSLEKTFFYDIYDAVCQKRFAIMIKDKDGIKIDVNRPMYTMQMENYFHLHTHLALVHLFYEEPDRFPEPSTMRHVPEESYYSMGIITSFNPLTFQHMSYAYFFVVRYIMNALKSGDLETLCDEETFEQILCTYNGNGEPTHLLPLWAMLDTLLSTIRNWKCLKWLETHEKCLSIYKCCRRIGCDLSLCLYIIIKKQMWNMARLIINRLSGEVSTRRWNKYVKQAKNSKCPLPILAKIYNYDGCLNYSIYLGMYSLSNFCSMEEAGARNRPLSLGKVPEIIDCSNAEAEQYQIIL